MKGGATQWSTRDTSPSQSNTTASEQAIRSALGSKLTHVLDSEVIIVGKPEEVTDRVEIGRLEQLELELWAPGAKTHWVRIPTTSASGRRSQSSARSIPRLAIAVPTFARYR